MLKRYEYCALDKEFSNSIAKQIHYLKPVSSRPNPAFYLFERIYGTVPILLRKGNW